MPCACTVSVCKTYTRQSSGRFLTEEDVAALDWLFARKETKRSGSGKYLSIARQKCGLCVWRSKSASAHRRRCKT